MLKRKRNTPNSRGFQSDDRVETLLHVKIGRAWKRLDVLERERNRFNNSTRVPIKSQAIVHSFDARTISKVLSKSSLSITIRNRVGTYQKGEQFVTIR